MSHIIIALVFCLLCTFFDPRYCFIIAGFYIGREIAQAEYRYIETFCNRKRTNMPWYAMFLPAAWTIKGMCDWMLPLFVTICYYLVVVYL